MISLDSFGPEVEAWQIFLTGQGLLFKHIDSLFDKDTEAATISFQKLQNITTSGAADDDTYNAARKLGFVGEDIYEPEDKSTAAWPPRPTDLQPIDDATRQSLFGQFHFKPAGITNNPEAIIITDTWERDNIITIDVPQLRNVKSANGGRIQVHKKAAAQFLELFEVWEHNDLSGLILSFGGSFAARFIRGSRTKLSNHSYGSAFDINVAWNYLGTQGALVGCQGSVRELVPIANKLGFYWGGHYRGRLDPMHFEIAKLIIS